MKKFTLLLCLFVVSVMMPQLAMADPTVVNATNLTITIDGSSLTISSLKAGTLKSFMDDRSNHSATISDMKVCTSLVIIGNFNGDDLTSIQLSGDDFKFTVVDMSQAKFPKTTTGEYFLYINEKPSSPDNGKKYVVGGTLYKSKKSFIITELDPTHLPVADEGDAYTKRDDWCHLKINEFANSTHKFKLKHAVFYKYLGNIYVVNTSPSGNYEAIVNTEEGMATYNGNEHVKINIGTQEEPVWKCYDRTPQYLPVDESTLSSGAVYQFKQDWPIDNLQSQDFGSLSVGAIFGVSDGTWCYYDAVEHYEWEPQSSYTDGDKADNYYSNIYDAKVATEENKYIVVGGTPYLYNNNSWTDMPEENDWKNIQFGKWGNDDTGGTIEKAILPTGIYAADLDQNHIWTNGKCGKLTEVRSGTTVATISRSGTNTSAELNVALNSAEGIRMMAILKLGSYVGENNFSSSELSTGLNGTTYTVQGSLADKISEINGENEIQVLDLKNATGVDKTALQSLRKSTIQYIILPVKQTKDFVCDSTNYYTNNVKNIRDLKAVISSDEDTLVAYVIEPGSLAKARCYATGEKETGTNKVAVMGLKSVTLAGNLNDDDISTKNEDKGLSGEMSSIIKMDLEKAYFANPDNMSFLNAGFQGTKGSNECKLKYISLPTTERMTEIPTDCFRNLWSLDSLCIPFNYKIIHNGALYDSNVEHLTTTDSIRGALIDNGPLTYTLSANLERLGDAPTHKLNAQGVPEGTAIDVFPKENGVKEIYTLATKVPKCFKNVFSYALTFGYGGQDQEKVYSRDRYFNNGDSKKSFVVLRYPSKEVFDRRMGKGKPCEVNYATMVAKYTDTTKVYTKKDQTGAVDANGNPLLWPARTEGNRAYNQASVGALWDDWGKTYSGENNSEINDGEAGVSNSSRSAVRRFEGEVYTSPIDLSVGTSAVGVKTDAYKFTPKEDWTRMLQYLNMSMKYDTETYNKIVVHYTATSDHFHVYADGIYDLPSNQHVKEISLDKETLDEFTIYNSDPDFTWSGNTGESTGRNITIDSIYITKTGANPKKLYVGLTNGKTESVVRERVGGNYTFQPIGNVKNMFQYKNMPIPTAPNNQQYQKIVVEFGNPVPKGFNIHAYGERNEYYSLEGLRTFEIPLNGNNSIEDFTIFNWEDAYWNEDLLSTQRPDTIRKIEISRCYFTTEGYSWTEPESSKYKHDMADGKDFDLVDYTGWHQIILTQAAYYEPVVKKEDDIIKRNYKNDDWYTFCIPFDLTYSQVIEMMGIPASTSKVENSLNGTITYQDSIPDIRQLQSVTRTPKGTDESSNKSNIINIRLTTNLADKAHKTAQYLDFTEGENNSSTVARKYASTNGTAIPATPDANDDPICLVGGRPYFIKPYIRDTELKTLQETYNYNLGLYIMKRYAAQLNPAASCVNKNDTCYYEQMETFAVTRDVNSSVAVENSKLVTMRFAKPYENHKVQAVLNDGTEGAKQLTFGENQESAHRYYYTMVGQFWDQELPLYCVYWAPRKQKWYRYINDSDFPWEPYKCVIMATPEVTEKVDLGTTEDAQKSIIETSMGIEATEHLTKEEQDAGLHKFTALPTSNWTFKHFGGGFRDISKCYFPINYIGTYDWISAPMRLWFYGRDDQSFDNQYPASSRYIISMDDNEDILDYGENVTDVKDIKTLDGVPQSNDDKRVYNMSGQYLGNSTVGLPKGVYIVGGRKMVVE